MRFRLAPVALSALLLVPPTLAAPASAATAQSRSCAARAARLAEARRPAYLAKCKAGSRPAPGRTGAGVHSTSAKAVVDPSGVKPAQRSEACTAEANRRGLHDAALQAFRDHCVASIAPVGTVASQGRVDTPTPARSDLGPQTSRPH